MKFDFIFECAYVDRNGNISIQTFSGEKFENFSMIIAVITTAYAFRLTKGMENWNDTVDEEWANVDNEFYYGYDDPEINEKNIGVWYTYRAAHLLTFNQYMDYLRQEQERGNTFLEKAP